MQLWEASPYEWLVQPEDTMDYQDAMQGRVSMIFLNDTWPTLRNINTLQLVVEDNPRKETEKET